MGVRLFPRLFPRGKKTSRIASIAKFETATTGSASLGDAFPRGLLVVQDGFNVLPDAPQNLKYIDWRKVSAALELEE